MALSAILPAFFFPLFPGHHPPDPFLNAHALRPYLEPGEGIQAYGAFLCCTCSSLHHAFALFCLPNLGNSLFTPGITLIASYTFFTAFLSRAGPMLLEKENQSEIQADEFQSRYRSIV